MAGSLSWMQQTELGMDSAEEEDEGTGEEQDFERYLNMNGVLGLEGQDANGAGDRDAFVMDDHDILGLVEARTVGLDHSFSLDENGILGLEQQDVYYTHSSPSLSGRSSYEEKPQASRNTDQISFDLSDRQDSGSPPLISSVGEHSGGLRVDDSVEDIEPGNLNDPDAPRIWMPTRDRQLDMTEDEQERASSGELERPEADEDEGGSQRDEYPDLPYDGRYESDYDLSAEAMQDSEGVYEEYRKVLGSGMGIAQEEWEQSGASPDQSRAVAENLYESDNGSAGSVEEAARSISQLGETLGFPSDLPAAFSERMLEIKEPSPLTDSSHWNMSQSLLSHVSMEDLLNNPGIDDETFPESSHTESVEDSAAAAFRMSTRGRRPSQSRPALADKFMRRQEAQAHKATPSTSGKQLDSKSQHPSQTRKTNIPALLPSKSSKQSRSLSPKRTPVDKKTARSRSPQPTPSADLPTYGRGQLNYPLPDFSKVEARVKFDQSYRPPRGRSLLRKQAGADAPLIFKSPAEIVREVLLSSTETSPLKMAASSAAVPAEFKSPRQATELVHQLQEDYNKLLTKYAEAENTIDRLRLGAKVNLYADPPKPSHSVQMAAVSQGSKVMAFTIPQPHVAQFGQMPAQSQDSGSLPAVGDHSSAPQLPPQAASLPRADGGHSTEEPSPGEYLTQTLAKQADKFQRQVESFEDQLQKGKLPLQEQLKVLQRLKGAQDALERAYLQAREEHRLLRQRRGPAEPLGEFDPDRLVEGEIFRLGMQLEELKDGVEQSMQSHPAPSMQPEPKPSPTLPTTPFPDHLTQPPTPSAVTPIPAVRTPYPETPIPKEIASHAQVEVSSASSESEDGEGLPEPLLHKRSEVEKGFDHLLGQYNSFKTLPDAMGLETGLGETKHPQEVDGAAGDAGTRTRRTWRRPSLREERSQPAPQPQPMEEKPSLPSRSRDISTRRSRPPSIRGKESQPKSSVAEPNTRMVNPKSSLLSRQSSVASATGSHQSEHLSQKRFLQPKVLHPEERIVSPETDSGFVGSDGSRISPQTPEQHPPQTRNFQELSPSPSLSPPSKRNMDPPSSSRSRLPDKLPKTPATSALRSSLKKDDQRTSVKKEPHVTLTWVSSVPSRGRDTRQSAPQATTPRGSRIQTSSPSRWSESMTDSENGQDGEIAHVDSEAEEHSDVGTFQMDPSTLQSPSPSASPSPSPPRTRTQARDDLISSRLARDKAIHALQDEVSRLRQRLEETLQRPLSTPKETLWNNAQAAGDSTRSWTPSLFGISTVGTPEACGEPLRKQRPSVRVRSASLPRDGPELDLSLESDRPLHRPRSQTFQPGWANGYSMQRPGNAASFVGPYTGTEYNLPSPRSPTPEARVEADSYCPHCHGARAPSADVSGARKQGMHSTPKQVMQSTPKVRCPLCSGSDSSRCPQVQPTPVMNDEMRAASSRGPERASKGAKQQQPDPMPGVWVMAGPPPPSTATTYIPTVPLVPYSPVVPYSPSIVYCASPTPTSTSPGSSRLYYPSGYRMTELQAPAVRRHSRGHRRSMTFGMEDLEDLRWSLSRAVDAAQSMKLTTKRMSRSLTCDLSNARSLRESCLF
ncbi:microtubule organization protein AKNA [Ambystoma mexicanum]|uniref:microtubule organization protein AKNA n=1 Tax=Ambystoma mexicanum TaxID=8296 RepID=UPI0037E882FD